ncbi:MAG: hypothetical protein CSA75_04815 [Sorangium cellulosum]|nr:MAG: hypothetical protein CSA75_04815 [Sorangium cellulosum]
MGDRIADMMVHKSAIVVLAGIMLVACEKRESVSSFQTSVSASSASAGKPFSCEALQKRAETCELQTLAQLKAGMKTRKDAEQQYEMMAFRLKKKLRAKKTQSQCEKFREKKGYEQNLKNMKTCYAKLGCDAFAKCILGLE